MSGKRLDLIGKRFGKLVVVEKLPSRPHGKTKTSKASWWKCVCDCGNETEVIGNSLSMGNTKSCGCLLRRPSERLVRMEGQRFNKLLVLSRAANKESRAHWNCLCDCGSETVVSGKALRSGATKSCGCLGAEVAVRRFDNHRTSELARENEIRHVYNKYQSGAEKRGYVFELTLLQFMALCAAECHYCGRPPSSRVRKRSRNDNGFRWNGVDRLDNSLGYTVENSVPCCWRDNKTKSTSSYEEFIEQVKQIYENLHLYSQPEPESNEALRWSVM